MTHSRACPEPKGKSGDVLLFKKKNYREVPEKQNKTKQPWKQLPEAQFFLLVE